MTKLEDLSISKWTAVLGGWTFYVYMIGLEDFSVWETQHLLGESRKIIVT